MTLACSTSVAKIRSTERKRSTVRSAAGHTEPHRLLRNRAYEHFTPVSDLTCPPAARGRSSNRNATSQRELPLIAKKPALCPRASSRPVGQIDASFARSRSAAGPDLAAQATPQHRNWPKAWVHIHKDATLRVHRYSWGGSANSRN